MHASISFLQGIIMNEQIKKIVEQTYVDVITTKGMTVVEDGCYIVSPDRLEQYTHAVVKECIKCIQLTTARDPRDTVQYKQSVGHIHRIRDHFGVE